MKKTRFSEEQIVRILRQAETADRTVAERDLEIDAMQEIVKGNF